MPTCQDPCEDHEDHDHSAHIDVAHDVLVDVIPVGEEIVEETGVKDILAGIVGSEEANQIVTDVITPIIDSELINNEVDVDEIIDAIED